MRPNARRTPLAVVAAVSACVLLAFQSGCGNANGTRSRRCLRRRCDHRGVGVRAGRRSTSGCGDHARSDRRGRVGAVSIRAVQARGTSAPEPAGRGQVSSTLAAPSRSTVTDARGRFSFPDVAPGTYLLTGIAENHIAGVVRATVKPLTTTTLDTTFVDIAMMPTGKFYGTVTLENATNHRSTIVYVDGSSYVAVTNAGRRLRHRGRSGRQLDGARHPSRLSRSLGERSSIAAAGDSIPLTSFQLPLNSNTRADRQQRMCQRLPSRTRSRPCRVREATPTARLLAMSGTSRTTVRSTTRARRRRAPRTTTARPAPTRPSCA